MQKRKSSKRIAKDAWMKTLKGTLPRVKKVKTRVNGVSEASIQRQVEAYLQIKGLKYVHIPDEIYRLCSPISRTPIHVKRIISESLKGLPDLMIFKSKTFKIAGDLLPTDEIDTSCLLLELKKKNAKARQSQRRWHDGLPVQVVDNTDDAIKLINKWSDI